MWISLLMLGTSQNVCHSERGRGTEKGQKLMSQEIVLLEMWYLSPITFCLSVRLKFSFSILWVVPIILQLNDKTSLKKSSQMWR